MADKMDQPTARQAELDRLYEEHGELTPRLVLKAAKPSSSPLHSYVYDKRQREAAEAYYLDRAHELIRSYKMSIGKPDGGLARARKYHAVRAPGPQAVVYKSAEDIAQDPFARAIVLRDMERQWRELHARFSEFEEFVQLVRRDINGEQAA